MKKVLGRRTQLGQFFFWQVRKMDLTICCGWKLSEVRTPLPDYFEEKERRARTQRMLYEKPPKTARGIRYFRCTVHVAGNVWGRCVRLPLVAVNTGLVYRWWTNILLKVLLSHYSCLPQLHRGLPHSQNQNEFLSLRPILKLGRPSVHIIVKFFSCSKGELIAGSP